MASNTKASILKRAKTLKRKAFELATLCGVDAALIIFEGDEPPHFGHRQCRAIEPHTWPESPREFSRILKRYRDCKDLDLRERKRPKIEVLDDETEIKKHSEITEDIKMLLAVLDSQLLIVKARIRVLEAEAKAAEGIRCIAGAPDGVSAITAFNQDWQVLCDDETVSPLQLLMNGPDFDPSYDHLFLSQLWGCGVGSSFTNQRDMCFFPSH